MSAELAIIDRVRAAVAALAGSVGVEGDAASMAGSLHGKLEAIYTQPQGLRIQGTGPYVLPDLSIGAALSAGGGGSYGAWVTVVAAAAADLMVFGVQLGNAVFVANWQQVQLAIGAAGAEVPIAVGRTSSVNPGNYPGPVFVPPITFPAPVKVAAGSRISARANASINAVIMVANAADVVGL